MPWKNHKVTAGVLQLTLGISVVIGVITGSIILLGYYTRISLLRTEIQSQLVDNANSGIQYMLGYRDRLPFHILKEVDLYEEGLDSVQLYRSPWGLYESFRVVARRGMRSWSRHALITSRQAGITESVLYLPERQSPLYVSGHTVLEGTAYLPERGITTSFISGKNFTGKKLLYGEKRTSTNQMPPLDTTLIGAVNRFFIPGSPVYKLNPIEAISKRSQATTVFPPADFFYAAQAIDVTDTVLTGNLVVQSAQRVRVSGESRLSGVMILAPEIEVDEGFQGDVQLFATKFIKINRHVSLRYPSSLVLLGQMKDSLIVIGEGSRVEGQVMIRGMDFNKESAGVFRVEKDALFHGCAYVNGTTEVQGTLLGHLSSRRIQASQKTTVYANHLLDATLSHWRQSVHMPGSLLWGSPADFVVAKWVEE